MTPTTKTISILIVNDSPDMRRTITNIFRFEPEFEVIDTAENGLEALEKAIELEPDVILMDNSMPVMDGLEATDKIKRVSPEICVIMLSTDMGSRLSGDYMAITVGAYAFFKMPLTDFDELYEAIRNGVNA